MSALLELIRRTDDDYLAGLTNKGTVKRAYKDLEQASPAVSFEGEMCIRDRHKYPPFLQRNFNQRIRGGAS